ncbi:MAG: right-handed parallel beta-helix repeat-containing protein [Armatimonadetes bacterium]|nr:right-handed parallel beta-helix repeat-containing protein [Armatimonadota bacterium]
MRHVYLIAPFLCLGLASDAQPEGTFLTDPDSPELQAFAKPMAVDESKCGCGPLRQPGETYYVSLRGDDKADGLSWPTAWRQIRHSVSRLRPGDTLVIGEGEYYEPHLEIPCEGEPGRPITIMAAPRQRVVLTGATAPGPLRKTPGARFTFQAEYRPDAARRGPRFIAVWESDTLIALQNGGDLARVDELPGTFCYDEARGKLYVRFSDSRGPESHGIRAMAAFRFDRRDVVLRDAPGVVVSGSYLHLKGLRFQHYHSGLLLRGATIREADGTLGPYPRSYRGGHHITVEACAFTATDLAGLAVSAGAQWNLIKGNYGVLNGVRGSILIMDRDASDNLIVGNWLDPSPATLRRKGSDFHYGINYYLAWPASRNHILNNTMNDTHSLRSKCLMKEAVIQGNVLVGELFTYPLGGVRPREELFTVRGNVLLGRVAVLTDPPALPAGENWIGPLVGFCNNFAPTPESLPRSVETARFADPAYVDYRLQSDSPLIGKALGGGDVGAFRQPQGGIFYVSPQGSARAAGTSERLAFQTLRRAAAALRAGDTLYVMEGDYNEPLVITASGEPGQPIRIRAHGKRRVALPEITVAGSSVTVEGFTVSGSAGDGITIRGRDATIRECLLQGNAGAGIRAEGAKDLNITHCTLVGNGVGLALERGSTGAAVRDSLFADNRLAPVSPADDSRQDYLVSNNAYFGPGVDEGRVAAEPGSVVAAPLFVDTNRRPAHRANAKPGSVVAAPLFVDTARHDYRLRWDSPAAHLAAYARAAGAFPVVLRAPAIAEVTSVNIRPESAVVAWTTPMDDTTGRVAFRPGGTDEWSEAADPEQGTVHAVGLTNLKPGVEYEFRVFAEGRRGGEASSPALSLKTSSRAPLAATYYLSPSGDDAADGRSPERAWRTLRKANAEVGPGDTVLIAPGEYYHPVAPLTGGKPGMRITYRRHGDGEAIIQGGGAATPLLLLPSKSYVTVEGLILTGTPYEGGGVARISDATDVELLRCRIGHRKPEGPFGHCILASGCRGLRIEGNVVWGTRYHVTAGGCTDLLIRNNTFTFGQVYSLNLGGRQERTKIVNNIFHAPVSVDRNPTIAFFTGSLNGIESDHNLFSLPRGRVAAVYKPGILTPAVPGTDLKEWQEKSGRDRNSLQTAPLFVDPEKGDFRLRPGSPAIGRGQGGVNIGALGMAE